MKAMATESRARKRILYIDQNENCRGLLAILLGAAGYEIDTATTIANGLALIRSKGFDLFILESNFIDGFGTDLCRDIRAVHPHTPIIFFSSSAHQSDIEAGLAAGAQHYLTKPLGIYVIEQTIAELFGNPDAARPVFVETLNEFIPYDETS